MKKIITIGLLSAVYAAGHAAPPVRESARPEAWPHHALETDGVYGAGIDNAYRLLDGQVPATTVTVALIGYGLDVTQDDLAGAIWSNPGETPNGKDDDGNGYVDDLHGWNFLGTPDGKSLNRLSRVGDREFFRLKDKYARYVAVGSKCYTLDTVAQQVVETAPPPDRREFAYFWHTVLPETPVGGQYMGVLFARMVVAFVHSADGALRAKFPGRALTKRDFETLYDGYSPDTLTNYFSASVQLLFMSAGSERWDDVLAFADTKYVQHQQRSYENRLRSVFSGERKYIGDNPYDINDRPYGNNNLASANAGRGTMLASLIAARRNNGVGIDGIAEAVRIMPLRVDADANGEPYMKDLANAIRYAVDKGADIIQLGKTNAIYPRPWSQWVDEALRYAEDKGVLVVIPMMDLSHNVDEKAFYPTRRTAAGELSNVITVAASDAEGRPYGTVNFSNRELDLFAPGVVITSISEGGELAVDSGSELAAAMVSGVAALVKSYYPAVTPAEMRRLLVRTVTPRGDAEVEKSFILYGHDAKGRRVKDIFMFRDLCVSGGILNAARALGSLAASGQIRRQTDTIPFDIVHGKFIIQASINGKPARLIMDTGGISTLTADTVSHYGWELSGAGAFADVNNAQLRFGAGTVDDLRIGDLLVWKSANITAVPNNGFFRSLGVAGTVGGELFQAVCLTIDKRNRQLTISYPYRPKGVSRLDGTPMELGQHMQPRVPMTIGGRTIPVLFDTGLSGFLALGQQDYAGVRSAVDILQTGYGFMHVGIGGIKNARRDTLYKVSVPALVAPGGKEFRRVHTVVLPQPQTIVGQALLDYGRVMLDFPRGLFYFFPYDDAPVDLDGAHRMWNVKILPVDAQFEVTATLGDCDVRAGERVWNINGVDLAGAAPSELFIDGLFAAIPGDTAWILVGHDRKHLRKVTIRKM